MTGKDIGRTWPYLTASAVLAGGIALQANAADTRGIQDLRLGELKEIYLACERQAQGEQLATDEIRYCSEIYETLKETGFGGSFRALKEWFDLNYGRNTHSA